MSPPPNRKPWRRGVAGAALLVLIVLGLARTSFNVDILKLLPGNLRQVQGLSMFLRHFAERSELIITVEAPTPAAAETAADGIAARLNAMPRLVTRAVARPPWEKQPAQLAEIIAFLALNQPPEKAREIAARLSAEHAPQTLRETVERLGDSMSPQEIGLLGYDPFDLTGSATGSLLTSGAQASEFASSDGAFHVVYVESAVSFENYNHTVAWIDAIHRATAEWQGRDGVHLGYTGEPAIVASISQSMQRDMQSSGVVTLLVIAFLFWFCYRRFRPLLELQAMLLLIFAVTLAIAGLGFDQLTVIGVGSSAILIGLSVDYGYFVYQRAQHSRGVTLRELQRQCVRYIAWTAGTTAAAFFALNVSSLPGLSQLGNLVGVGVVVGAVVMLGVFAPLAWQRAQREGVQPPTWAERLAVSPRFHRIGARLTAVVVILFLASLAWKGLPGADFSAKPLRPRNSDAYETLDRMAQKLTDQVDPLSLVVEGGSVDTVLERLHTAETQLAAAQARGDIRSFRSALTVWPVPANQRANQPALGQLAADLPRLRQNVLDAGFKDEAFTLTEAVLRQWAAWKDQAVPIWPDNEVSRWIFRRIARHDDGRWYALGIVQPVPGHEEALDTAVKGEGIYLTGWNLLTIELKRVIPREFGRAVVGIAGIILLLLALAFRDGKSLLLFVAATALVFVCLTGAMSLFGLSWNVFNFAALLLLIGTGTDYSILLLLALRRNGGDVPAARKELFLVICLCAGSATAGFGTISWASHAGLASLGQTCALGLLIDAAVSVFLLPVAWAWLHRGRSSMPL